MIGTIFTTKPVLTSQQKSQRIQLLISVDETIQLNQHTSNPPTEALLPAPPSPMLLYKGKISELSNILVKSGTRKIPVLLIPNSNFALGTRINRQFMAGAELHDQHYLFTLSDDRKETLKVQEFDFEGILYKLEEQKRIGE